ncbi:glycerate kinase [Nocardioides albertanoniae]|uniref:Glycerate kinase n=1 Tax=Nocardioides albertanoniae TaxID=1175486 RepID=A0A543A9L4_9ACTN|nr:glycerate kinase [Nocardioides albertanoniae]TQL69304.1 glycerate kinase [Nocardioides albertanoniae]
MRVLIAPDKFAGTLSASQAAAAIAEGWRRTAPGDELSLAPMADGGPGFLELLGDVVGGQVHDVEVTGPHGEPVTAQILVEAGTAYIESAQAAGLHLADSTRAEQATSYGVGQLLLAARETGATTAVIGLGGSGTSDGGAGLLAALGATGDRPLDAGVAGLEGITEVRLPEPLDLEIVIASDVDNPLTGLFGAVKVYGAQKGLSEEAMPRWDGALQDLAAATSRKTATEKGAGAAGGMGFALLLLGATRRPGFDVVADLLGLTELASKADLVITGEGSFDPQSASGKVPAGVAKLAEQALRPCIVMAGKVSMSGREMRTLGIDAAYSLIDSVGEERALAQAYESLVQVAARVARTWSTDHRE